MEINSEKVRAAISTLNAAADALMFCTDDEMKGKFAAECIKSAAALRASLNVAGISHFRAVGEMQ